MHRLSARITAASELLNRGWGRPAQPLVGDDDAAPLSVRAIAWLDVLDPNASAPPAIEDQSGKELELNVQEASAPAANVSEVSDVGVPAVVLPAVNIHTKLRRTLRERAWRTPEPRRVYMRKLMRKRRAPARCCGTSCSLQTALPSSPSQLSSVGKSVGRKLQKRWKWSRTELPLPRVRQL
jgi:hypothetical protein